MATTPQPGKTPPAPAVAPKPWEVGPWKPSEGNKEVLVNPHGYRKTAYSPK